MNMISTGAFLNEMDASSKQPTVAEKFAAVWEKKNAKAARAGGVSLMALSLAACGGSSSTTTTSTTTDTSTTTTVTPVSTALTIGADAVTGTSGDDTVSGARIDSIQTWNSGDTVDGGAGTDSLTAVITADVTPAAGAITGVENLTITNANATTVADLTVTFSTATVTGISGVSKVTNLGSTDAITFTRLVDLAEISINNTDDATTVTYADSLLTGTADAVTLSVNGATGAIDIGNSSAGGTGIETLNIVTSGALSQFSAVNLDASATTVNVTGSGALDINAAAAFASVGTFDASAATGDIDVTFLADGVTGTSNTKTISTGSGADEIDISNIDPATVGAVSVDAGAGNDSVVVGARGATDFTIAGGEGTDTLSVSVAATATLFGGVSGFERLTSTGNGETQSLVLYTGNSTFTTVRASDDTDFTNATGITTLELNGTGTADNVLLSNLVDGSADTLTVKGIAAANAFLELSIADVETLTLDSNAGTIDAKDADATNDVVLTDATSVTAVGDNNIDLGEVGGAKIATVDLTGLTADADFTAHFDESTQNITVTSSSSTATSFTATMTVTTGSGADTITGTKNVDVLSGGQGNDTITGGDGDDTLTGGTGSDTFVFAATGAANNSDTIADFTVGSGGDVLNFSAFLSGATIQGVNSSSGAITVVAGGGTGNIDVTNKIVLVSDDAADLADYASAAAVADEIDLVTGNIDVQAGGKAIILFGDDDGVDTGTDTDITVFFAHDANGDGDFQDSNEVLLVATLDGDNNDGLDSLVSSNFVA